MLNFSPSIRIFLHAKPIDMRKSFDGLFGIVSKDFGRDVRHGGLFLFLNHRRNRVKLLYWDNDGLAVWMKRLEVGCYQHPAPKSDATHVVMDASELHLLLSGIDLSSVKRSKRYVAPVINNSITEAQK
jgi:transposase